MAVVPWVEKVGVKEPGSSPNRGIREWLGMNLLYIRQPFGDNGGIVQVVLQVLGGLFLLALFLAVSAVFFIRWKMRQLFKALANTGGPSVPLTLDLRKVESLAWADARSAGKTTVELVGHGFTPCESFVSDRIPGLKLAAFLHEGKRLYGVLYEHPAGHQWIDLAQRFPDDTSVTVTNATMGEEVESPPWSKKVTLAGSSFPELLEEMEKHRRPEALPVLAEEFEEVFSSFYERSMKWQVESGAINDPDDITQISEMLGVEANESDLAGSRQILKERDEKMRSTYLEARGMTAAEWEGQRSRTVFVHSRLSGNDMEDLMSGLAELPDGPDGLNEEVCEFLWESKGDARAVWKEMLLRAGLKESIRLDHSMEEPTPCDVYVYQRPAG